jgi:hypothetical protein
MDFDNEEEKDRDEEEKDLDAEEEGGTFSKVGDGGGMFGGDEEEVEGGDEEEVEEGDEEEGDEEEGDEEGEKKDEKKKEEEKPKVKAKPKSLFDLNALKEFGLSILALFIETLIISVLCINILFYCTPESIKNNSLYLEKLFPTERDEWPYCYTNEYTSCEAKDCDDKFGGIADNPKLETPEKLYLKAAILLDTYVFKWFCLSKEEVDMVTESIEEGITQVNLLHWEFIKARFKQWINNAYIFSFSSDRAMLIALFKSITKIYQNIPKELYSVVSPLIFLLMPFVLILLGGFVLMGGPFFTCVIGMILNPTNNRKEFIGGSLWSLFTAFGFGIFPIISFFVQLVQFIGTFFIYPLFQWDQYRELYAKHVPIIFFFFNLTLMFYAFEYLDLNIAAIVILMLLVLYLSHYWQGIMEFVNTLKNWSPTV